jgi:hypothetical protein
MSFAEFVNLKSQRETLFLLFLLIQLFPGTIISASPEHGKMRNTCEFLGGRADKNFMGSGNVALVIEPGKTKVLFVQQWKENGIFDWAAGTFLSWSPDRIEMNEAMPPPGASISYPTISRSVFITRDDVIGMELVWKNSSSQEISIIASFTGKLPGNILAGQIADDGWTYCNYSTWPRTNCHFVDGVLWAAKSLDTSLSKNAAILFDRYTRMHFPNGDVQKPNIAERYDPHTGKPYIAFDE